MKFGEKLKKIRKRKKISQQDLADSLGVSLRTVGNYENEERYPQSRDIYEKLSEIFEVDINFFLTEDEDFFLDVKEQYGLRGVRQARRVLDEVSGLFAGGDISEEDKDELMRALQDAYWIAKDNNKKYIPKKYRNDE